jgi:hypothetical protein
MLPVESTLGEWKWNTPKPSHEALALKLIATDASTLAEKDSKQNGEAA